MIRNTGKIETLKEELTKITSGDCIIRISYPDGNLMMGHINIEKVNGKFEHIIEVWKTEELQQEHFIQDLVHETRHLFRRVVYKIDNEYFVFVNTSMKGKGGVLMPVPMENMG